MPMVGYKHLVAAALPGTLSEIIEKSGMLASTVCRWLRKLREEGACHVGGWERTKGTGGPIKRVYVAGPGEDVMCKLKRAGTAVYSARYRKKNSDKRDTYNARRNAINAADRALRTPNTWLGELLKG